MPRKRPYVRPLSGLAWKIIKHKVDPQTFRYPIYGEGRAGGAAKTLAKLRRLGWLDEHDKPTRKAIDWYDRIQYLAFHYVERTEQDAHAKNSEATGRAAGPKTTTQSKATKTTSDEGASETPRPRARRRPRREQQAEATNRRFRPAVPATPA